MKNPFQNQNIAAIGDSITNGYNGYYDLTSGTYPEWLGKDLDAHVDNYGVNAASISDEITDHGDMGDQVNDNINFKKYDTAVVFYGTNDWRHSAHSLSQVIKALNQNLNIMKQKNSKMKIYAVLPLRRYDNGKCSDDVQGNGGYTMNQLCDALKRVYANQNIPCLDWRIEAPDLITDQNYKERFNDQHLHPTPATYKLMAKMIGQFMVKNV
ncbi:hypothetical protein WR164_12430 [Philodulcilactobacillus myokoensis]|uniref:SGNH hydrolase-type esterase domain-containing protein n=1 Tax=Philodulcilactobacillus myokoensis TaxID=2929573 RepID=A0A9W6B3S5_9LACO|nr:SGNH/GDSL hydrolase family protein [Philodulcilactobacillus myokoensis]GLB47264.1 hypothetical protein WR164_12430 [Philodulcilactobacillus myokoensis]